MAHFARIEQRDGVNIVVDVVVINNEDTLDANGNESEAVGAAFCQNLFGVGPWVQTSYNHRARYNYAAIGYVWDEVNQAFIPPKPFASWVLNADFRWDAPTPIPDPEKDYVWDEANQVWVEYNPENPAAMYEHFIYNDQSSGDQ